MTTATLTLEKLPGQVVSGDTYKIDLKTRDVLGPALHDPARLMGFQKEAHVQRVMVFADDLWAENPQMAVGMYPVFVAKGGGLFVITLAVESVTVDTPIIPNPTPSGDYYRIIKGSSLSFMCPPGHPNHFFEVRGARRGQIMKNPHTIMAVSTAAEEWGAANLPTEIVRQARELLAKAELVHSELWERHVYGYFKNCYSKDGVTRDVSNCLVVTGSGMNPEHHLAYMTVKEYFPDATPRLDLIESKGDYGTKPCAKCGTRLQYEAKVDRFAEAITCKLECPKGGEHEV